ncbi:lysine transporter LysE [Pseudomonas sp. FW300-N1A1]|uniref:LysE family translocator n=1 Tax=Pseudomonas sp. FW300-N1A1 TaxID=2075555 RepID=UPI000CD047D3|nr:LysE family translocator [Pseudomonas sp. FW300-N1A1]POA18120.1 lysine transporter LysE [Pseudomonas sp. FW300-N1A1]
MIDLASLWIFVGAVMLLLLSPGPNMAFFISHGVSYGWRGGVASGLGIGLADLLLTALTAAGITTLVAHWPPAFELIRYAGVAYLLWLAFKALHTSSTVSGSPVTLVPLKTVLLRAMFNSLLNPKALLFFMVFLPQFVRPEYGPIAIQLMMLGVVLSLVGAVFHSVLGVFGGALSRRFSTHGPFVRLQSLGLAVVLVLLAIRLALMTPTP